MESQIQPPPVGRLPAIIESILFVAQGPVAFESLARTLNVTTGQIEASLDALAGSYRERGLRLQRTDVEAQMVTAPETTPYVKRFLGVDGEARLSRAALETLAIIAYRQPISRPHIEAIRGVNCERAVATLKDRGLITEAGRATSPGRPYLLGTTFRFLEHFGLERPEDLPSLPTGTAEG